MSKVPGTAADGTSAAEGGRPSGWATALVVLAAVLGRRRPDPDVRAAAPRAATGTAGTPPTSPADTPRARVRRNWANLAIIVLVLGAAFAAYGFNSSMRPVTTDEGPCESARPSGPAGQAVVVADAVGEGNAIDILVPRTGGVRDGRSGSLGIQASATLPAGTQLATNLSELRREDGVVLPEKQIGSSATVSRTGREVTVAVCVSPRFGQISGFGRYTGAVAVDDPRARGGNVPVTVHVQYPYVNWVLFWTLLAALGGIIWTWLVRHGDAEVTAERKEPGARILGIRIAALLVAVPVVTALVLDDPDWTGDLSAYIGLATAAGAAVIAAAPTFRALASRIPTPDERREKERREKESPTTADPDKSGR